MNLSDRSLSLVLVLALALLVATGCTAEAGSGPPATAVRSAETTAAPTDERPFDRGAAVVALKAVDVHPCVAPANEGATAHVVVTFGPSGRGTTAVIDDGPIEATVACAGVVEQFRRATVPAFTGEPVRVGYAFVLR